MSGPVLIQETLQAGVAVLKMNRPESRNALNIELMKKICEAIQGCELDTSNRILILKGADPVFCAGLDLKEAALPEKAEESAEWVARTLTALKQSSLVTIGVAQGAAYAGGAGLMRACDFVFASEDLKLCFPEVRRGLVPALVTAAMFEHIREADLKQIMLTGEPFGSSYAKEIGLVDRVVNNKQLDHSVSELVKALLAGTPEAVRTTKHLIREMAGADYNTRMDLALNRHKAARSASEALQGIKEFNDLKKS